MSKIFVNPDIHLKPWMFDEAEEITGKNEFDKIVMLGDLADDWNCSNNLDLYKETYDAAVEFARRHPNTLLCYGNHDLSYIWDAMESGYSWSARETAADGIRRLRDELTVEKCAYIHMIDGVIFSHGGLTKSFVRRYFDMADDVSEYDLIHIIKQINSMGEKEMWEDYTPIWARPQRGVLELFPKGYMQVVGHTPVDAPLEEGNLLTLDNFSTYPDGTPKGNEKFVWIDTTDHTWHEFD